MLMKLGIEEKNINKFDIHPSPGIDFQLKLTWDFFQAVITPRRHGDICSNAIGQNVPTDVMITCFEWQLKNNPAITGVTKKPAQQHTSTVTDITIITFSSRFSPPWNIEISSLPVSLH